jgi:hypothetical protein
LRSLFQGHGWANGIFAKSELSTETGLGKKKIGKNMTIKHGNSTTAKGQQQWEHKTGI